MNIGKRIKEREQKIIQDRDSEAISGLEARRRLRNLGNLEKAVDAGKISAREAKRRLRGTSLWRRILGKK